MKITLLGSGSPHPHLNRYAPATLFHTPSGPWLVDCGPGATCQLLRAGISPHEVTQLILTHLHADHSLDYGHFLFGGWHLGRHELRVWGPPGTKRLNQMYQEVYAQDIDYRLSLGRPPGGMTDVAVTEYGAGTVLATDLLTIDALPVYHSIETYALRFRADGQTIVHSGDTAYCESLIDFARGADILIHEAAMVSGAHRDQERRRRLHKGHVTPAEAGRIARLAGVRKLVLNHLPPLCDPREVQAECRTEFEGELFVGEDLLTVACR